MSAGTNNEKQKGSKMSQTAMKRAIQMQREREREEAERRKDAEMGEELKRRMKAGETLTAEALSEKYLALNRLYFGPDMVSDGAIALEWTRIPHFFYNYYVFQYATGFSAAVALANRILAEGESAVRDYKKFLSGGCSTDPISLLKIAGVDMSSPEPVNSALALFGELLDEMEKLA